MISDLIVKYSNWENPYIFGFDGNKEVLEAQDGNKEFLAGQDGNKEFLEGQDGNKKFFGRPEC